METVNSALKRAVSTPLLALYGIGNILGAGIYVLVGKVAGVSGYAAPLAFALAAMVASVTGLSYARLSSRFPKSASESNYALEAFHQQWLALAIGLAIISSGLVSSAAILHGFAAYLETFVQLPDWLSISLALVTLCCIAVWGIKQSIAFTAVLTIIEVLGLIYVLWMAWPASELLIETSRKAAEDASMLGVALFSGAFVAFYAYVGFEDMVNIAEEVRQPQKSIPKALLFAIVITTTIYILVALVAVAQVAPNVLAGSDAPLALIYESVQGEKAYSISFIALFAVINGALVNLIMCSRVVYGLANVGLLPKPLAKVNARTQTPVKATLLVSAIIWVLVLTMPLLSLAKLTSFILLLVFLVVNASCLEVLRKEARHSAWVLVMPVLGMLSCCVLMLSPLLS